MTLCTQACGAIETFKLERIEMKKSIIGALLLGIVTMTGFAGLAQAHPWECPVPITKGGCPIWIPHPHPGK
jgi:hypothetical protein